MGRNDRSRSIYTVVDVWRGVAVGAKSFTRRGNARKYMQRLRRGRNLEQDDVKVFENTLWLSAKVGRAVR